MCACVNYLFYESSYAMARTGKPGNDRTNEKPKTHAGGNSAVWKQNFFLEN